jgi:hypothetical protein
MDQHNENSSNDFSRGISLVSVLVIALLMFGAVILEQMTRPEKLLARTGSWQIVTKSTSSSDWSASDGASADYVDIQPTSIGFQVILQSTESATREAYFNDGVIPKDTFLLSADVNTPAACHNGLVFRGNAEGEYYLFLVSSESSYTVEILQREAGQDLPREAIILNTKIPDSIGQTRSLAVIGRGASYYFYINGVYVNQMHDARLHGNRTGVEAFT